MDRGRKKGRKGKECELCTGTARMYCESDEAMLCWECDARVHGANFLVARHTRALLCRTCQSPTPWRASGSRLGPSVSLCHRCSPPSQSPADDLRLGGERGGRSDSESEDDDGDGENGEEDEGDSEMEDSAAATAEEEEEEEEEGENQVVPWSPPPTSSSSSEESSSSRAEMGAGSCGGSGSSLKRMRDNADLASHPQDDLPSSSLQLSLFTSAQPPLFSGRTGTDTDDDDGDGGDDDGETASVGGSGSGSNRRPGFQLPKDRRRRLAQPTSSTRRSQPTTAGEPCSSSRAAISTIDFVQAT